MATHTAGNENRENKRAQRVHVVLPTLMHRPPADPGKHLLCSRDHITSRDFFEQRFAQTGRCFFVSRRRQGK